jgi:histone acetyltransferase
MNPNAIKIETDETIMESKKVVQTPIVSLNGTKKPFYTFETIKNNGNLSVMKKLIDLKNIFAKQLPKMPKEYISRLMFDRKHESIAIKDEKGKIFGGICYRVFEPVKLSEIVFLAVMSERQIKGFGTKIMNELKMQMQTRGIRFLMTCADNLAIGYFQKQGFHKDLLMPSVLYKGYLKDYEGSTLMECLLHKEVNYREVFYTIRNRKKELIKMVEGMVSNHEVYPALPDEAFFLKKILAIASIHLFVKFNLIKRKKFKNQFTRKM